LTESQRFAAESLFGRTDVYFLNSSLILIARSIGSARCMRRKYQQEVPGTLAMPGIKPFIPFNFGGGAISVVIGASPLAQLLLETWLWTERMSLVLESFADLKPARQG
jgi:hypothetical protein